MVKSYKGFDKDLKCRGMQYEVGKDYKEKKARVCQEGLHSCQYPLDVFNYYDPANSRFCEVEADGDIDRDNDRDNDDSKIASTKLHIGDEIGIKGIIEAGIKVIFDKVDWKNDKKSNDENYSAATNTGDRSAATNTGYQSAATNTGDRSAATVEGKESIAIATGYESKARASLGSWIGLAEWQEDEEGNYHIVDFRSMKVDGENIKANTFYTLENGEFVETE